MDVLGGVAGQRSGSCASCALEPLRSFRPGDPCTRADVGTPEEAAAVAVPMLHGRDRERCLLLALDAKHRLIAVDVVSLGSVDRTFMGPREVYRDALLRGASAIVLAHNHPSGDPEPSREDRLVTRRLAQAGRVVGVELLDHLVVGDPGWESLARLGAL